MSQNDQLNNAYELHDAVVVQKQKKSVSALAKTLPAGNNQTQRGADNSSVAIILSSIAKYNREFAENEEKMGD